MSIDEQTEMRLSELGYVFQDYALIPELTAAENVMIPLLMKGFSKVEARAISAKMLERIGLSHRMDNKPSALSGGEQQRVAIARALASGSEIIFADEPTGNLDAVNGKKILDLFLTTIKENKKTFIIITHDMNIARQMDDIYEIKDGMIHLLHHEQ